mmetsp:Transcript_1744/g.5609  ORF Transcript_1744/g.5609 Transcript_1744/m.5609 type:complete len:181 (-) Transcript_1744:73-615(-)
MLTDLDLVVIHVVFVAASVWLSRCQLCCCASAPASEVPAVLYGLLCGLCAGSTGVFAMHMFSQLEFLATFTTILPHQLAVQTTDWCIRSMWAYLTSCVLCLVATAIRSVWRPARVLRWLLVALSCLSLVQAARFLSLTPNVEQYVLLTVIPGLLWRVSLVISLPPATQKQAAIEKAEKKD